MPPKNVRRLVENFAFLPHRAEAQTTVLSKSRLAALSRCPDAPEILRVAVSADNGTLVIGG